ncbi:hypothetical protein [Photobacterium sp. GB-3]|uniref:hypothetical protein n=1 Tax=Photobacterium sp. GB-3 TaxID=2022110 RepID=UPI000D15C941|nr:hypothetical protein [Photobacterium sp. GB-3]PSV58986.1 hypothetical protein C9J43_01610 [Photobacterium sp. GB-3]
MLIYVNQFKLVGENSSQTAFRTVAGWLKNVTNRHFTVAELKSGDEFSIDRMKVRTYLAVDLHPYMYSVLFTHPDRETKGRQWITEIGIREEEGKTTVSILLETSDISTLVTEIPSTTKPRLVNFLQQNGELHNETVGLKLLSFSDTQESLKALSFEIERKERKHPLVLVSNLKASNKPVINPQKLQEQLLGLAQVVYSDEEINSWEMESTLGRKYSAWDGAVNIIYPSFNGKDCHTKLFSQANLNEVMASGVHALQYILSHITHTTNGFNKKKHFSPSAVRAKRQKDQRTLLKKRFEELSEDKEYQDLAEQAFAQLEEQENLIEQLKQKHELEIEEQLIANIETQDCLDKVKLDYQVLDIRFKELQGNTTKVGEPIIIHGKELEFYNGEVSDLVIEIIKNQLLNNTKQNSRRYHLLQDIVKHNEVDGTRDSFAKAIKSIFSSYNGITPKIKSDLKNLNMEAVETGTHNHIKYINDDRYQVAFAKTPSDAKRVGNNIARDIKAELL